MRSEREKITGKVAAATLRLNIGRYELPPDEDTCYLLLVSEGSVTLEYEGGNVLVNPGSAVLLGPGGCRFSPTALNRQRRAADRGVPLSTGDAA